jgi:hypothetical protein
LDGKTKNNIDKGITTKYWYCITNNCRCSIKQLYPINSINIYNDKILFDELIIYTKECKNCISKKCPGGYNCKFGTCSKDIKICYNDMMSGKCFNITKQENKTNFTIKRCIHGVHLTEKNLIPYYLRIPIDFNSGEFNLLKSNNINYNSKNNIISLLINDDTVSLVKELLLNKNNKLDIINNFKNNSKKILNNINEEIINEEIINEEIINEEIINEKIINEEIINEEIINEKIINEEIINEEIINEEINY